VRGGERDGRGQGTARARSTTDGPGRTWLRRSRRGSATDLGEVAWHGELRWRGTDEREK
jgi:hypothetical protein